METFDGGKLQYLSDKEKVSMHLNGSAVQMHAHFFFI
jgi:hypothetical protein